VPGRRFKPATLVGKAVKVFVPHLGGQLHPPALSGERGHRTQGGELKLRRDLGLAKASRKSERERAGEGCHLGDHLLESAFPSEVLA